MKRTLTVLQTLYGRKLAAETQAHLSELATRQRHMTRRRAAELLRGMRQESGPKVTLGQTEWNDSVDLPLEFVINAHSILTGGTGCGKTMAALLLIDAILR